MTHRLSPIAKRFALACLASTCFVFTAPMPDMAHAQVTEALPSGAPQMMAEPFLQLPTEDSVNVVWFTNVKGRVNQVICGEGRSRRRVRATTTKMERMFEDASSRADAYADVEISEVVERPVWRHEATCHGLEQNVRVPYRTMTIAADRTRLISKPYTLQPAPTKGQPLNILLTSDQQNRQMSPAGYQKAQETVGKFDMVLVSGDYVDNPRKASEWFDRNDPNWRNNVGGNGRPAFPSTRPPFFPALNGTFQELFPEFPYKGGEILQHSVIMGAIGNHEVPGRFRPNETYMRNGGDTTANLGSMDNDPQPRWYAALRYEDVAAEVNPANDPAIRDQWIADNSQDFDVHREMWSHPEGPQGESYYSFEYGDAYVIVMNVSRIWRTWNVRADNEGLSRDRGKFIEWGQENNNPDEWGFGDFHYERFDEDSEQFAWLKSELESEAYQNSKYKIVLAHHTIFGLGDNAVPVHAQPVMYVDYEVDGETQTKELDFPYDYEQRAAVFEAEVEPLLGSITEVRYEYPLTQDLWKTQVEPLLLENDVQLVHVGHSHVWNRAKVGSINYIETSNYGNTFGAYWAPEGGEPIAQRTRWAGSFWGELEDPETSRWNPDNYAGFGDPHGREAIFPTLANPEQLFGESDIPVPYVASNDVTVFSYIDTEMGAVRSFAFDTRDPSSEVIEFDRFSLLPEDDD
ncbi:MAG: metallophosphoesterase [Pseudomonadota bacterium]